MATEKELLARGAHKIEIMGEDYLIFWDMASVKRWQDIHGEGIGRLMSKEIHTDLLATTLQACVQGDVEYSKKYFDELLTRLVDEKGPLALSPIWQALTQSFVRVLPKPDEEDLEKNVPKGKKGTG